MAEAIVGLAASIAALAALASTTLKFVGETRHVVRDMRSLAEVTERPIDRIRFAAGVIQTTQTTLSKYSTTGATATTQWEVIQFIDDKDTASYLKSESEHLSLHVDKIKKVIRDLRKQWWLPVATLIWRYIIKEELSELRENLEFILKGLAALLGAVQLEVALKRHTRDEAEIQHFKDALKEGEREIKRLRKTRVSLSTVGHEHSTDSLLQQEIEDNLNDLLRLTRTLRKKERVPRSTRVSSSLGTSVSSTRRTWQNAMDRGERSIPHSNEQPVPPRLPSMSFLQDVPSRPEVPEHSHVDNAPKAPYFRASSKVGSEAGPSQAQVATRRTPSIRSEDDFIGVRSSGEALKIVMSSKESIVQGRIRYQDGGELSVKAILEPEQGFNFMTSFRASELGLLGFVQLHEDDHEESWIVTPGGRRIRPDGTIQLRWCPPQSRSISLQFFVLPSLVERQIVLGAPYVKKTEYYAGRGKEGKDKPQREGWAGKQIEGTGGH